MTRRITYGLLVIMLAGLVFIACGDCPDPPDDAFVTDLLAGQTLDVGNVTIWNNETHLFVLYEVTEEEWYLTEVHLDVECDWEDIPHTVSKNGDVNPIPGHFEYDDSFEPSEERISWCQEIEKPECLNCGGDLAVAAHAVVSRTYGCEDPVQVYGTQRSTGIVYAIDPYTGTAVQIFQTTVTPTTVSPNGLAYDSINDRYYYTTYQGPAKLYFWNGTQQIFSGNLPEEIACADFYDGKYYYIDGGSDGATDDLYEVSFNPDGTILVVTAKGDIAGNLHRWTFGGDIAISPDGMIYGWGLCGVDNKYEFFTVNRDGSGFSIITQGTYPRSQQLAFGKDGKLYGHDAQIATGPFYEINTTTGALTFLANQPQGNTFTDLASEPLCVPITETETAWGNGTRFNTKGNWGMYIPYHWPCIIRFPPDGTAYIGYEDAPGGDYDYNDFGMIFNLEEVYLEIDDTFYLTEIHMNFNSTVKKAGYNHDIHINRTGLQGTYDYTITRDFVSANDETPDGSYPDMTGPMDVILFDTLRYPGTNNVNMFDEVTIDISIDDPESNPFPSTLTPPRMFTNEAPDPFYDLDGIFEFYDPWMDPSTGANIYIVTAPSTTIFGSPAINVPFIIVVPETDFAPTGEGQIITTVYDLFDDFYRYGSPDNWWE